MDRDIELQKTFKEIEINKKAKAKAALGVLSSQELKRSKELKSGSNTNQSKPTKGWRL